MNRVREQRVLVRNPRNPRQVMDVSLAPADVVAVGVLVARLRPPDSASTRARRSWLEVLLSPDADRLWPRAGAACATRTKGHRAGGNAGRALRPRANDVAIRPIVLGSVHTPAYHEDRFGKLAEVLAPMVRGCIISFLDPYPSARRELAALEARGGNASWVPPLEVRRKLAQNLVTLGQSLNMSVQACCEPDIADVVAPARCIDPEWIRAFAPAPESSFRFMATRKGCGCVFARDVGAYHTCAHGCVYCYANESPEAGAPQRQTGRPHAITSAEGMIEPRSPERKRSFDSGQLSSGTC